MVLAFALLQLHAAQFQGWSKTLARVFRRNEHLKPFAHKTAAGAL